MKIKSIACLITASLIASVAQGQAPASAYAGQEERDIKSLSPEEVDSYLAGKGMGLAKAAELNGYAGPGHVLEMASQLDLTAEQHARTEALFAAMASEAARLGRLLVSEERKLDRLFATKAITPDLLTETLTEISTLQGKVRAAHLRAHIAQVDLLTLEQNQKYHQLRGYEDAGIHADHGSRHGH